MVLNLLVKPGWVLLENVVQDRLGHATFGLLAACSALAVVVATFADLGLSHFTVQRLAVEPGFADTQFPTLLPLRGLLTGAALALLLAVGLGLGYRGPQLSLLAAVGAGLLLSQYTQFLRAPVQARQRFGLDAWLSVLEKTLALALVAGLVLGDGLRLGTYVGARLAAAAFTAVLLLGLLRRLFGPLAHRWPAAGPAGALLRGSLPFAAIALLYGINERVDMVLLERLASAREAGYYAAAYRWLDAVMMYVWTILPLFFARFAQAAARPRELGQLLLLGQRVLALPLLLVVAFIWFRGEVLFWQFGHSTPPELARMTWCLRILALNVLVHGFFALYAALLNSTGHVRSVSWLVALSVALNLGLNLALVPHYGAVAAAYITLGCALVVSGGYVALLGRVGVVVPWRLLGQLLGVLASTCAAWAGLQAYAHLPWLLETLAATAVFGLSAFGWRVLTLAELRRLRPGARRGQRERRRQLNG